MNRSKKNDVFIRNRSSSGAALIVVLILSAIIYLAVSTVWLMTMTEIHLSDFERRSIRAFYLAETAIVMGVARLRTEPDNLSPFSDTVPEKLDVFNVTFTPKLYDEHKSWYHLTLEGSGIVSGQSASATRRVSREIVQKPFVLFAEEITLKGLCKINGNIHGNQHVEVGKNVKVDGHISSSTSEPVILEGATLSEEETPALEPEIDIPLLSQHVYSPKYLYNEQQYEAQPLSLTTSLALSSEDSDLDPPASVLNVYRGEVNPEQNPAGVFYLTSGIDDEANNSLSVIDVQGGSVLLSPSTPFRMKGFIRISAVEHFPALLNFGTGEASLELFSFDDIKDFLDVNNSELGNLPKKNTLEGLLYSAGPVALITRSGSVTIDGSIWADSIVLDGSATLKVDFAPRLLTNPPPGLKVVEYKEWNELM